MPTIDSYLGIHAKALMIRDERTSQLATNLANANTPNYKAQDINFNQALTEAMTTASSGSLSATEPGHLNGGGDFSTTLQYRIPTHGSLDGNTVDKEVETMEFTKNSLDYQATLSFLDSKIKSMMMALKGD